MSRSIAFNGCDLSSWTSAEAFPPAGPVAIARTSTMAKRPGEAILSGLLAPKEIGVRLFLDLGYQPDADELDYVRRRISGALAAPEGATLTLPNGLDYEHAILAAASAWTSKEPDATCDLTFLATDPIAKGSAYSHAEASFTVGGTWPTEPIITVTTHEASLVRICYARKELAVRGPFTAGQHVRLDCANREVYVDDERSMDRLVVTTSFFAFEPGACEVEHDNCDIEAIEYRECWA